MPCYDSRDEPSYVRAESKAEIDKLTRLLCEACRLIENMLPMPTELKAWWKEHKEVDRERREADRRKKEQVRLRKGALAKLSPAERKALGVSRFDK